jgi:restriction system protein
VASTGLFRRRRIKAISPVRLWDIRDLVEAIYRNFEKLPAEIQAELPLEKVWMLLMEEPEK